MASKWKFFKTLVYIGALLSILSIAGWVYFYLKIASYYIGREWLLLIAAFIILLIHSLFLIWLIKDKFPSGTITNTLEGVGYFFSIILFIACLFIIIHNVFFVAYTVQHTNYSNWLSIFLKYLSIGTILPPILYIYIGANTFILINSISKKRAELMNKISEIGK